MCFARWSCGGDCYYKWLITSGGGEFSGSARCHVIRELTKDQILDKIASSGGLFWHDPPGNELLNREDKDSSKARTERVDFDTVIGRLCSP